MVKVNIFTYHCYQCIKLKKNFLTTNPSTPLYLLLSRQPQVALAGRHFIITPHFQQLCCMDNPFLAFRGKRVVNREKLSYFPFHNFFCSLFVYVLKKIERNNSVKDDVSMPQLLLAHCHKSYQTTLISWVQLTTNSQQVL